MKTILVFLLLLLGCLWSCIPEKIDLVPVGTKDTIRNLENRLNRSVGDTCNLEKHWINFFDGRLYRVDYLTVTEIESKRHLKTKMTWIHKGEPLEDLVEGVAFTKAVVVRKY
jgi:hypothetical protein